ncbi:vWA domain-containing protein [Streptomyces sp. ATexAB-D23]|uniref:vWA domain-containing protein n=1 Tax=unclassified Streptomyces TaxID=2593676 RepID=UPI000379D59F|nr:vWA domain-containing protein [Streptomyces sp. ATexAB-D23]MYY01551.1 VWA domain-containing protein [Streptomyces sp. SID4913]
MKHTGPSRPRRYGARCAALLAAALLAATPATTAHAAPAAPDPTRAEIYRALRLDQEPADYVILVDTSGSMTQEGRYNTVRSTLRPFLDGLTPEDHVALFTFDSRTEARYVGEAGDTSKIIAALPGSPDPDGDTDIGAALDAALKEVARDDASPVASIVLLTDGEHRPAAHSRYPKASGPAWNDLNERAESVAGHTELAGYAIPLGGGATGAGLLGNVVPDTTVLRPDGIQDLGAYLSRAGDRTRARKAARLLAPDIGKGVTATWQNDGETDLSDGSATAKLTLRSTTARLPLTVTGLHASVTDPDLTVRRLPDHLTLEPGASRTYEIELSGRPQAGALPYRRTEHTRATLRLTGKVTSAWQRPLAPDVRLKTPQSVRVAKAELPLRATVGSTAFLPALAAALVLIAGAGWLAWRRVSRPPLRGVLLLSTPFGGPLPERIVLQGRRMTLRPVSTGGHGTLHGRRRSTGEGPRVDLHIRFTPDGSEARTTNAVCGPGGEVVVGGVSFTYLGEHGRVPAEGRPG